MESKLNWSKGWPLTVLVDAVVVAAAVVATIVWGPKLVPIGAFVLSPVLALWVANKYYDSKNDPIEDDPGECDFEIPPKKQT